MKLQAFSLAFGKVPSAKSLTAGLLATVCCALFVLFALVRGFQDPGTARLAVWILPMLAYAVGLALVVAEFLKEWRQTRADEIAWQQVAAAREAGNKNSGIRRVYLTYLEDEANAYLQLGWVLLRIALEETDCAGQRPGYVLGWLQEGAESYPRYDSRTGEFAIG